MAFSPIAAGKMFVALVVSLLLALAKKGAKRTGDRQVLHYGWAVKVYAWGMLFGTVYFAYIMVMDHFYDDFYGALGAGCIFVCGGLAIWIEMHFVRIEFDSENIYTYSLWRKNRVIAWNELDGYGYSNASKWHRFGTQSKGIIRVSIVMSGLDSFFEALKEYNNPIYRKIINYD